MISVISLVALSAVVADASWQPAWQTDYRAALVQGARQHKPLAVFLAPGKAGWDRLAQGGMLSRDVRQLLLGKYVAVYLNTDTEQGKALASSFEVTGGLGLVLSDRGGLRQAFWHDGALAAPDLARALDRHADPTEPPVTTETTGDAVTTPAGSTPAAISMEPTYRFQPAFGANCSH